MSPHALRTTLIAACLVDGMAIAAIITGHERIAAAVLAVTNLILIRSIDALRVRKWEER